MINLIPNEEKKKKVKDFYFRLTVVFFAVVGFSVIFATVSILPAFFLSLGKKNLVNTLLESQKNIPVTQQDQKTLKSVEDLEKKINLIESTEKDKFFISQRVVNEIILKKMSDIKIEEISYENTTLKGKIITIKGTAMNRERLLLFRKRLEDDVLFKKVDLPISNFIKGSNITFSLSLIPA